MKASTRSQKKPPYGPNIVRAWFDTVIQPALRGLETEQSFLKRNNWTFRFHPPSLEFIGPLREHLPGGAAENLDQFLSFFPGIRPSIDQHDRLAATLLSECQALHEALVSSQQLHGLYRTIERNAPQTLGSPISRHFGAYSTEADFIAILAELIVNNTGELPPHYGTAKLWSSYRDRLTPLVKEGDFAGHQRRTVKAGAMLLKAVGAVSDELREIRSRLSLEFDVPPYLPEAMAIR